MGKKLPGKIQSLERHSALPSPFHYTVKTESVLPTNYKKIGFGYGNKSNSQYGKLSPGPGDYNLSSFTDRFRPSLYRQARRKQDRRFNRSIQGAARDWSLAKPLTGGVFDPNGVVTKQSTVGFNYPPLRPTQFFNAGSTMFYKSDGFNQKNGSTNSPRNIKKSTANPSHQNHALPEMGSNSEASSISR